MNYFAVRRHAGPAWVEGASAFEQPGAAEHTAFMNSLAEAGMVIFAGPVAGTEHNRIRVLLIARADSESEIHSLLANDPWAHSERLVTASVEKWSLLLGADRLPLLA